MNRSFLNERKPFPKWVHVNRTSACKSHIAKGWQYSVGTHCMLCGAITMRTKSHMFPQWPWQAYFWSYLQNCSNKYFLYPKDSQRLDVYTDHISSWVPWSCLGTAYLQRASKRLPQHAPGTGKHTQASIFFEGGWATWSCEQAVTWRERATLFFMTTSSHSLVA